METPNNVFPEMDVLLEIHAPSSGLDWMSKDELRTILNARTKYPTLWIKNSDTKYLDIRVDCRSMHALVSTQRDFAGVLQPKKYWRLNPNWKDPNNGK